MFTPCSDCTGKLPMTFPTTVSTIITRGGRVTNICISKLGYHWLKLLLVDSSIPDDWLIHWGFIVNWILGNQFQWTMNQNTNCFIQDNNFKIPCAKYRPRCFYISMLTHWGRAMHICVGKLSNIGSDNGLAPTRHQAIVWTNAGILLIRTLATNLSEILNEIHTFSFKKMHLNMSPAKWRPFCHGLNMIKTQHRRGNSVHLEIPTLRSTTRWVIDVVYDTFPQLMLRWRLFSMPETHNVYLCEKHHWTER